MRGSTGTAGPVGTGGVYSSTVLTRHAVLPITKPMLTTPIAKERRKLTVRKQRSRGSRRGRPPLRMVMGGFGFIGNASARDSLDATMSAFRRMPSSIRTVVSEQHGSQIMADLARRGCVEVSVVPCKGPDPTPADPPRSNSTHLTFLNDQYRADGMVAADQDASSL
jgi:hypothetical protein